MTAEWVLTKESEALLAYCDEQNAEDEATVRAQLAAIEQAAIARAAIDLATARMVIAELERVLSVDNVARALHRVDHPAWQDCELGHGTTVLRHDGTFGAPDWVGRKACVVKAEAIIAALTEDVP